MAQTLTESPAPEYKPLISAGFLRRTGYVILAMAVLTMLLSLAGRWMGERIASGGHSTSTDAKSLFIGDQALQFPANTIRFEHQRQGGTFERIDLYVLFPEMQGYSDETRQHFNDTVASDKLLFLTIEQASIPLDMSGRFEPVYKRLIDPTGTPLSGGLTRYRFQEDTRYGDELLYIGQRGDKPPFVVRCLNPSDLPKGSRSCLRDLAVGQGLSVAYRFSEGLLDQWRTLDPTIVAYVANAMQADKLRQ